ncbi:MAG: YbaN family protein [Tistlia sp.]|uniref:YbaN family protein n=1 Tax=Tistlia sp. TaxID=3057121 RepID=UPI0034A5D4B5
MTRRSLWLLLGLAALGFGLAGVVLPLLPTTPFVLLAAFAFARSSPRLHAWLTGHRQFGPLIEDWRRDGAIAPRAKVLAAAVMAATFAGSWIAGVVPWVLAVQAVALGGAALFVLSRPSSRRE